MEIRNHRHNRPARFIREIGAAIALVLLTLVACSKKPANDEILAIVGDRIITTDEFIRRAEYTMRPPYCRLNSSVEKQIVLNSLIAEKLFAFEAGDNNALAQSPRFQAYVRGRQEQIMRQYLYAEVVKGKTKPDTSEFEKRYKVAGRTYRLAYFTTNQKAVEEKGKSVNSASFDELFRQSGGIGAPPDRAVEWKSPEHPAVHTALFSEPLQVNQVVGPIQVDRDEYLMVKVLGWRDQPAVTSSAIEQRSREVTEELEREKGEAIWSEHVFQLMKDKRLDLQRDTFEKLVDLMRPIYLTKKPNASALNPIDQSELPSAPIDSILKEIELEEGLEDRPFCAFDGRAWTVADFFRALASHPLVFRKRGFSESEFPEQFKLAIADLMRDQIVNRDAYDKGLDQSPYVKAHTNMWRDALLAMYHKYGYLESKGASAVSGKDYTKQMAFIENYLNAYTDSLLKKYNSKIQINVPNFERIQLTRIDMVVMNENVPYLEAVPAFPSITTKNRLDYGTKLE